MALKDHSIDNRIIAAARKEFYEYGFTQASLRKIASRAEVTTGALYTRYKNKDELFEYLVSEVLIVMGTYGKEAMEHLKQIGTVIYLKLDYTGISRRLSDIKGRGVVLKDGQTLKDLYDERIVLYEKYADITIAENGLNVEQTIEKIVAQIQKESL